MEYRVVLVPTEDVNKLATADHGLSTYQVEIKLVFEQVQTLHDILVPNQAHDHDLRGDASKNLIIPPRMIGYFVLDNELDGHLETLRTMLCSHHEPISTGAQFVSELVGANKVWV